MLLYVLVLFGAMEASLAVSLYNHWMIVHLNPSNVYSECLTYTAGDDGSGYQSRPTCRSQDTVYYWPSEAFEGWEREGTCFQPKSGPSLTFRKDAK